MWNVSLQSSCYCPTCGQEHVKERIVGRELSWEEASDLGIKMRLPSESVAIWPSKKASKGKDHR